MYWTSRKTPLAGRGGTVREHDVVRGTGCGGEQDEKKAEADCPADQLRHDEARPEGGAMPPNVSLKTRPTVTAGFANDVEDVNQYAAPM